MFSAMRARSAAGVIAIAVISFGPVHALLAQQPPQGAAGRPAAAAPARATAAPLAFKVEWVRPASQADTSVRYMPVQQNIADPKVEIKYYGAAAKQILTTGAPGSDVTPYGVWTGTAEG